MNKVSAVHLRDKKMKSACLACGIVTMVLVIFACPGFAKGPFYPEKLPDGLNLSVPRDWKTANQEFLKMLQERTEKSAKAAGKSVSDQVIFLSKSPATPEATVMVIVDSKASGPDQNKLAGWGTTELSMADSEIRFSDEMTCRQSGFKLLQWFTLKLEKLAGKNVLVEEFMFEQPNGQKIHTRTYMLPWNGKLIRLKFSWPLEREAVESANAEKILATFCLPAQQ
ncbi:MAG: hypothetical protein PHW04_09110 [Candidatus Wallbacteria bacterium]|nr:hypothetical protein [Candidatus Wallbacteria bacterium]